MSGVPAKWLILAVPDFGPHPPLFSADLSPTFACFFCSHGEESPRYSNDYLVIVPDFPALPTGEPHFPCFNAPY
jgi:hypothetical protein